MRWEQAKSMEEDIGRKRNRAGEEKGRRELRQYGSGKGLGEGREEREMQKKLYPSTEIDLTFSGW